MTRIIVCMVVLGQVVLAQPSQAQSARKPVYVQLFTSLDDYYNLEMTLERMKKTVAQVAETRKKFPASRAAALLEFTGASADQFSELNANLHTVDELKQRQKEGLIEFGYNGLNEPAPLSRPRPNFRFAKTPLDRWKARTEALEWFLTEHKEWKWSSGEPDPARSGGLKKVREMFGPLPWVTGVSQELGGDQEAVHLLKQMNPRAVLPGLPENTTTPAKDIDGFNGAAKGLSEFLSPAENMAPEVFWQDNGLRLSNYIGMPSRIYSAHEGPDVLKAAIEKLNRSRPHVIRVELSSVSLYLKPAYAGGPLPNPILHLFQNPRRGGLPPNLLSKPEEIAAAYVKQTETLEWLASTFFPGNDGSRFIVAGDLLDAARSITGSSVARAEFTEGLKQYRDRWSVLGNYPPTFMTVGTEYLSMADLFQALASSLSRFKSAGALPDSIPILPVYGPLYSDEHFGSPTGTVKIASVIEAAVPIASALEDQMWRPVPRNAVPDVVEVDGIRLNPSQYLRLMIETYLNPTSTEPLKVQMASNTSDHALVFPSTRRIDGLGAAWTLKPAPLKALR